jgi:hypothetical protein
MTAPRSPGSLDQREGVTERKAEQDVSEEEEEQGEEAEVPSRTRTRGACRVNRHCRPDGTGGCERGVVLPLRMRGGRGEVRCRFAEVPAANEVIVQAQGVGPDVLWQDGGVPGRDCAQDLIRFRPGGPVPPELSGQFVENYPFALVGV